MTGVNPPKMYHCLRCDHFWPVRPGRPPARCPKCTSRGWNRRASEVSAETKQQTIDRLLMGIRDICRTSTHCAIGRGKDGRYQTLTPAQQESWLKLPKHYGEILFCINRYVPPTSDSLGERLFGDDWWPART